MTTKTTKAQLEVMLAEVTRERDVLRSRLDTGHAAFRAAKAEIDRLRAELAAKPRAIFVKPHAEPKPVVTRFYKGGVLWEKTRIGNRSTSVPVVEGNAVTEADVQRLAEHFGA